MNPTSLTYRPIGVVHSPFTNPSDTPIQAAAARDAKGLLEIYPEFVKGLLDISGFSHLILLCHFHRVREARLIDTPFLDTRPHGIFATRAPARPNPIGISVVRLIDVQGGSLHVEDLDVLDETPLLDIKPFVPAFDHRDSVRIGWFTDKIGGLQGRTGDSRFGDGKR